MTNPIPATLSNLKLLDLVAEYINLATVDAATELQLTQFGKAEKRTTFSSSHAQGQSGKVTFAPTIIAENEQFIKLFPDKNLGNFSFTYFPNGFKVKTLNRAEYIIEGVCKLIVWGDLRDVYETDWGTRTVENVKHELLNSLSIGRYGGLTWNVSHVLETYKQVYKDFGIDDAHFQEVTHPYFCASIDLNFTFDLKNSC